MVDFSRFLGTVFSTPGLYATPTGSPPKRVKSCMAKAKKPADKEFLDQYTRSIMKMLCHSQTMHGDPFSGLTGEMRAEAGIDPKTGVLGPYIEYAMSKKWFSTDGTRIVAAGFATAARFLKR